MPVAIMAWPRFPSDFRRAVPWCSSMTYLHVQKIAAIAKVAVPNQFTAPNQAGDPLLAGMVVPAMSMSGIEVTGAVLDRAGSRGPPMAAYIQAVASIIMPW